MFVYHKLEKIIPQESHILFFDGQCILCNSFIDILLKRDKKKKLRFATLQGTTANKLLDQSLTGSLDSVVFYSDGKIYQESSASLRALGHLGGLYKLAMIILLVPPFIRNWVYKIISKNRYSWFGKLEECRISFEPFQDQILD